MTTGQKIRASVSRLREVEAHRRGLLRDARRPPKETRRRRRELRGLVMRTHKLTVRAEAALKAYRKQLHEPLRERAFRHAEALLGVVERGGNNTGPIVDKIIHENNGLIGEPWCGDFVAYCYRAAGSKTVTRPWASVSWLWSNLVKINPKKGDIVTFVFSHTGLYEKDNGNGTITTIEGNTGASGAVSDSATGGDGVYRKIRSKSLVSGYRRVVR